MKLYGSSRTIRCVYFLELIFTKLIFTSDELLNIVFTTNVQCSYFYVSCLPHFRNALISCSKMIAFPYRFLNHKMFVPFICHYF